MSTFIDATYNVLHDNGEDAVFDDLTAAFDGAHVDILGLQENETKATNRAVRRIRKRKDVAGYVPLGTAKEVAILWRTDVFEALPGRGKHMTHGGKAKVTPQRWIVWQPLRHKASGKTVLRINTHAINGFSHGRHSYPHLRDEDARKHFVDLLKIIAANIGKYDVILIGGDMNVRIENHDEWWYPGNLLNGTCELQSNNTIDPLIYVKGSAIEPRDQWTLTRGLHSDHALHARRYAA